MNRSKKCSNGKSRRSSMISMCRRKHIQNSENLSKSKRRIRCPYSTINNNKNLPLAKAKLYTSSVSCSYANINPKWTTDNFFFVETMKMCFGFILDKNELLNIAEPNRRANHSRSYHRQNRRIGNFFMQIFSPSKVKWWHIAINATKAESDSTICRLK